MQAPTLEQDIPVASNEAPQTRLLEQALALAVDLERLLMRAEQAGNCFQIGLARAHASSAAASLAELLGD